MRTVAENEEALFQALCGFYPVETQLRLRLGEVSHELVFPRQYHLLKPGQVPGYAWFLASGSARAYYLHEQKGEEITVWFWQKGDIMWALDSFCRQVPTRYYLQLLEDCTLLLVSQRDLKTTLSFSPEYRHLERAVAEGYQLRVLRHFQDRAHLPVKARYEKLMRHQPHLFNKASIKDIASFLGMFPDTLSRLRSSK
ncbi:Crp/Fnr family transcriptional regulator [Pontibacter sp. MBLB2868]|uniref:Crp/Fnr family transcriptional regulator n=1 Tax=Pontibacter sp. MBLB2868 TaxID=3451555 RepID=UPI003F74E445